MVKQNGRDVRNEGGWNTTCGWNSVTKPLLGTDPEVENYVEYYVVYSREYFHGIF